MFRISKVLTTALVLNVPLLLLIMLCMCCTSGRVLADETQTPQSTRIAVNRKLFGSNRSWFYYDVLPYRSGEQTFILLSLSRDDFELGSDERIIQIPTSYLWLTMWQVAEDRATRIGGVRIGNIELAQNVPQVIVEQEDIYQFFCSSQADVRGSSPVLRRSAGGWCWQALDTVDPSIRRAVTFADVVQGKVFNGTGQCLIDISKVIAQLKQGEQLVSLASQAEENIAIGLLGKPILFEKERPPLPYETLFFYSAEVDREPSVIQLFPVKGVKATDPDNPTLESKAVPGPDDIVTFGKPVTDGKRILYWYCIQQKDKPTYRVYILACYDGKHTVAIDGYIVNPPNVRYWNENTWVKEQRQLEWIYQPQIGFPVQPIVGKDADGKIISYRPPELWQLEFIPDVDKAQQNDVPAAILEK